MSTFNLPDVGEGLTEAEIVSWKVQPGDTVAINQVFVEIETAKSLVELPSPFAGTVTELCAAEGQTLEVGQPLFVVAEAKAGAVQPAPAPIRSHDSDPEPGVVIDSHALLEGADAGAAPLVGSGPKADPVRRRPRLGRAPVVKGPDYHY